MGLDDSVEESVCSSSTSLVLPPSAVLGGHQDAGEEAKLKLCRVLWCYCLQVEEVVEQKQACLVLLDQLLGLLYLPDDFTWTNQDTGGLKCIPAAVLTNIKSEKCIIILVLFYDSRLIFHFQNPEGRRFIARLCEF